MDKTPTEWMIEPLRRYAQFTGRARRAEFWYFFLFAVLVGLACSLVDHVLGTTRTLGAGRGLLGTLASLALIVPQLAVAVRRLHDIDRTGWWIALPTGLAIPLFVLGYLALVAGGLSTVVLGVMVVALFAAAVVLIVWQCTRGTAGPNRFGPDPLAVAID